MDPASCKRAEDVSAYVDGALTPPETADVERHLAECASCREALAAYGQIRQLFADEMCAAPPEPFVERVMDRVSGSNSWLAPLQRAERYLVAAILILAVGVAFNLSRQVQGSDQVTGTDPFFEDPIDAEVREVATLHNADLSRERVLGLLLSTNAR